MSFSVAIFISGAASLSFLAIFLATAAWHQHISSDWIDGVQKVHDRRAVRLGGIAIFAGAILGAITLPNTALVFGLLLAALPAFALGLAEDLTGKIRPVFRLLATLGSGLCIVYMVGPIGETGIVFLDWILSFPVIAGALTIFAVGGFANAINIIDGAHGLAAGTVLIGLAGIGLAAWQIGDVELCKIVALFSATIAAFLLFNFPHGLIFLGDAGAYLIGILSAGLAIALPIRNPEISSCVGLVAFAYPVIETLVSIVRRYGAGKKASTADGAHLHSLILRLVAEPSASAMGDARLGNPLTAVLLWPLSALGASFAIWGATSPNILPAGFALIFGLYLLAYAALTRGLFSVLPGFKLYHRAQDAS